MDQSKIVGGKCYCFDVEGQGSYIEGEFFETEINDVMVLAYACDDASAAGDENGNYYFLDDEDGIMIQNQTGVAIGEMRYNFDANGYAEFAGYVKDGYLLQSQNYVEIDEKTWNFDGEGYASAVNGYVMIGENGYYYEDGVRQVMVIQVVNEKLMYFDENGVQNYSKWVKLDGKFYYANSKGYLVTDQRKSFENDTKYAYFFENGIMACEEFVAYEGNYLYFGSDGWQCFAQWIELDGNPYYVDENGYRLSGMSGVLLDEKYNDFDENGIAAFTGYQYDGYVTIDGTGYYYEEGEKVTDDIREYDNERMYFDADGAQIISKWAKLDDDWYYANSDGHVVVNKYKQINKKWYYFDSDGIMASDEFVEYEGNTLYFGADGDQKFASWIERSEGDYYADAHGHVVEDDDSDDGDDSSVSSSGSDSGSSSDWNSGSGSSGEGSSEITESNVVSAVTGTTTSGMAAVAGPAAAAAEKTAQENSANIQAVSAVTVNQAVAIQVAGTAVSATVSQTTAGSVNGNTITSAAANTTVAVSETETASVATTAIAADGSARSLLASTAQGTTVAATEKAIQSGAKTVVQTYNDKVAVDLNQYVQVGSAVTYAVTPGTNGAAAKTQLEQTNFVAGQEIAALITDANGNVTISAITVGANGVVQYQIPGMNCIVRFMKKIG